jgi:hypothetical protein
MGILYRLDGHRPIPESDPWRFAEWFATADLTVMKTDLPDDTEVSTVFLGWEERGGMLFETMVFGGILAGEQDRYRTWQEAEIGHAAMVARAEAARLAAAKAGAG